MSLWRLVRYAQKKIIFIKIIIAFKNRYLNDAGNNLISIDGGAYICQIIFVETLFKFEFWDRF